MRLGADNSAFQQYSVQIIVNINIEVKNASLSSYKMNHLKYFLLLFILFLQKSTAQPLASAGSNIITENLESYYSQVFGFDVERIKYPELYSMIDDWMKTPYKYSGKNEKGIDCSGFVNKIYRNVFSVSPGINSADMYKKCRHLKEKNLGEGDLVFFKIRGKRISHVGIYLAKNKFAHASSSSGVIISDLNDSYYRKRFAKGGRVEKN